MTEQKGNRDRESVMACRDSRDESAREHEHREKVREVSERIRAENRDILNRLATK